jgi:hypothetical protein
MVVQRLNPDTAPLKQSIWKDINRATFELRTQEFSFQTGYVAGRRAYTQRCGGERDQLYSLPFEVERSLADDFAYIAACQPHVDFVSAAAIEEYETGSSFVLRLSANEGVSPMVSDKFNEIFDVLRQHAKKGRCTTLFNRQCGLRC